MTTATTSRRRTSNGKPSNGKPSNGKRSTSKARRSTPSTNGITIQPAPRTKRPKPGIYANVPFDDYLAWPHLNHTLLSHAARSMAHFREAELHPDGETADVLQLGTFIHNGVLEPAALAQRYVTSPDFTADVLRDQPDCVKPRATKQFRQLVAAFEQLHADKLIVTADEYAMIHGILSSLMESPRAHQYLRNSARELSIVWDDPETGLRCKARIDCWQRSERRITDLKSARDALAFERAIDGYSYHRQLAFYETGLRVLTGHEHQACLVAVEKAAPFGVRSAPLGREALEAGREECRQLLRKVAECRQTECWPGYSDPDEWQLPFRSRVPDAVTLSVNGQSVTL